MKRNLNIILLAGLALINWCWGGETKFADQILVGVGDFMREVERDEVFYKIRESVRGSLPVGQEIRVEFHEGSWTNKSSPFPKEAVLILEPILDVESMWAVGNIKTNLYLKNAYSTPGNDAYRGIMPYYSKSQVSNIMSNIKDYIATPPNLWLAGDAAVEHAKNYLQANPPARLYDEDTRYTLRKAPRRYRFGWIVSLSIDKGFFGSSMCSVIVGDDRQVKSVELF